ncbi:MAG: ABC transporter ATP-binding protein [Spirochaetaceae bacterium]|nr:ABC transporter ATP-binding protein [Spirochaetaceae bacterium]
MNERLRSVAQGFALAVRQAPGAFTRLLLLNVIGGAAPAAVLLTQKVIVDGIAGSTGDTGLMSLLGTPSLLAAAIVGFLVLDMLLDFVEQFVDFEETTFRDRILAGTKRLLLEHLGELRGILPFETPAFASRLNLAVASIPSIDHFGNALNYLMVGVLAVVPVAALTATLAWWVPLLMIAAVAPSMQVQNRIEDRSWSLEKAQAETAKRMDAHEQMLTSPRYAKETRLLSIGGLLLGRWQAMFDGALREVLGLRAKGRRTVLLWSLLSAAGVGGAFLFVVHQGLRGVLSAGDLALYVGSIFYFRRGLTRFLHCLVELQAQGLRVKAIQDVLDMDDVLRDRPAAARAESADGLVFHGVTFRYAGAQQDAVRGVSFGVPPGRSVALVGANRSGKTTLVKLA